MYNKVLHYLNLHLKLFVMISFYLHFWVLFTLRINGFILLYTEYSVSRQISYSFGTWKELISLTLFVMGKYGSVFEQNGF